MTVQVVELNLASRPFKNDTLPWVGLLVGVLLLGWATWWNVKTYASHRALLASLHESNSSMRSRFADLETRNDKAVQEIENVDLSHLRLRASKANEVIRWKSFSWTRLFNQLEEIQPWDVQMTSIHPVFRAVQQGDRESIEDLEQVPVSVEGVAKDLREYFKFQRAVYFDPHFSRVDPSNTSTDPNSGETVFRLRFLYDPRVVIEPEEETQIAGSGEASADEEAAVARQQEMPDENEPTAAGEAVVEADTDDPLASDASLKRIPRRGGGKRANAPSPDGETTAAAETDEEKP